ncbi:hypothetical protein PsorP6_003538 [Peronosclerospora sorghi]|uniref:Uncharacterized protein n=1 Tax=Peronosclerospora sorghi TaxID=230839 RepID=A0ACC0VNM8_9STRA|nr:hypothetical protein PsorP6_003538 [Peronosclerospora sorghi]
MELSLLKADVQWMAKPLKEKRVLSSTPPVSDLKVVFPSAKKIDDGVPFPCNISIPAEELGTENKTSLLDQHVTFKFMRENELVATHMMKLRECIPVLPEGSIHWTQTVLHNELLLHENKVVVGLLPVVTGCIVGIFGTAPVWLPLALFVGVIGFPIWLVVGVAMSLLIVFSAISAVVTIKLWHSKRVKAACQQFLTSQQGQLLLYQNMPGEESISFSALSDRARRFVLESPSRKLVASLAIDFVGNATFVAPGIGELADVLWAPASSRMVNMLYKDSSPSAKYLAFVEEVLPFTDFIPTATLAWMKENLSSSELDKLLKLTSFRKQA